MEWKKKLFSVRTSVCIELIETIEVKQLSQHQPRATSSVIMTMKPAMTPHEAKRLLPLQRTKKRKKERKKEMKIAQSTTESL